jgi:exo-1,4-beta-D-glucosaminidase
LVIPPFPAGQDASVYFVKLSLRNAEGKEISSNFYWLPPGLSTLAWDKTPDTAFTPIASFEDLTPLNDLRPVKLEATAKYEKQGSGGGVRVAVRNPGRDLAFMVHVGVRKEGSEDEILPVLWDDNYISLLPGESKELSARFPGEGVGGTGASVLVDGWNVQPLVAVVERGAANRR